MNMTSSERSRGRPREFDTDAALDQAVLWFREHGYSAASIADLTAATGLSAGSLYKAFKDKHGLFRAALQRYTTVRNAELDRRVAGGVGARNQLYKLLEYYAESAHDIEGRRGCLVVIATVELASSDADIAATVQQVLARNEQRLQELIAAAQQEGTLRSDIDAQASASMILALLQGLRVLGKTGRSRAEVDAVLKTAMTLLS